MAGPLPDERIEKDCGGRRDEKASGKNVQIAPASPRRPAEAAPSRGQERFPQTFQFRRRFAQDEIMIGSGQGFTQFSAPSFADIGRADRGQASGQSFLSWPGFPP